MKVTIGRIVRYVGEGEHEWPAIITVVHDDATTTPTVSLQVFRLGDVVAATSVPYLSNDTATDGGKGRGHTWHWPERA